MALIIIKPHLKINHYQFVKKKLWGIYNKDEQENHESCWMQHLLFHTKKERCFPESVLKTCIELAV